jgi:formiminotetrahydrofolate cyclodeaminase
MNSTKIIGSMVASFAAGVILGKLFSPGKEKKEKESKKPQEKAQPFKEKFNALIDDVAEEYSAIKGKAKKRLAART